MPDFGWNEDVKIIVVAFSDVVLVILVQHLAEHCSITQRLTTDLEPQVLGGLSLNLVDDADTESNGAQRLITGRDIRETGGHGSSRNSFCRGSHELTTGNICTPFSGTPLVDGVCHLSVSSFVYQVKRVPGHPRRQTILNE